MIHAYSARFSAEDEALTLSEKKCVSTVIQHWMVNKSSVLMLRCCEHCHRLCQTLCVGLVCVSVVLSGAKIVTHTYSRHGLSQNLILFSEDIYKYHEFDLMNWRWQHSIVQNG